MPKLITDDNLLREFIPNVFANVDDEVPLFSKLSPMLDIAESWLAQHITGQTVLDIIAEGGLNDLFANAATIVATHAYALAVPSLDLVLTPNGFGIVSNKNVVPASKDRVDRLIKSLYALRGQAITVLLPKLRSTPEWHSSEQCSELAQSILQDPHLAVIYRDKEAPGGRLCDTWTEFIAMRQRALPIEHEIANNWISPQLMARLCRCEATATYAEGTNWLIPAIRGVVCAKLSSGRLNTRLLDDIVTYIRSYPDLFPDWHKSATAELFTPPTFANDKSSGGYFF